jgi:hypothetical protein
MVADSINNHFGSLGKDLSSLQAQNLPAFRPTLLLPSINEWDVYNKLRKIGSKKASGPDCIPVSIIREFACELSSPLTMILNSSFESGTVPPQWKKSNRCADTQDYTSGLG